MRIVCISDTHSLHRHMHHEVPDGDVLIHAGDICNSGMLIEEVDDFNAWLGELPHKHKIVIAGNHDHVAELTPKTFERTLGNAIYLRDAAWTIDGVKFYGSPWSPWFWDWAFNFPREELTTGETARATWREIPDDTQVLITHGPMREVRDAVNTSLGEHIGCPFLRERIEALPSLKLHVFGHIHEAYGLTHGAGVTFINASICDDAYRPCNKPIVVDICMSDKWFCGSSFRKLKKESKK